MTNLLVHHHLGLGDHIDCNGLIRHLLKNTDYDYLELFTKKHYAKMISFMYRDDERVKVIPIEGNEYLAVKEYAENQSDFHFMRVGHEFYKHDDSKNCWEIFYEQLNLPLNVKFDDFYIESDTEEEDRVFNKLNPSGEDFIFVHDESSEGKVDLNHRNDMIVVGNDVTENVFHFRKLIKEAKEIHLIESSFKSIVEHFPTEGDLFFHDFGGHPLGKTKKNWEVIKHAS